VNFDLKNPVIIAGFAAFLGVALIAAGRPAAQLGSAAASTERRIVPRDVSEYSGHGKPGLAGAALPLVLGGFRGLVADFAWLRVQLAWEREDEAGVLRWSELASTADPEALPFWINSARMLAYDLADARWRETQAAGGTIEALRRRIDEEQAQKALRRLEMGARWLPDESRLWIEMGNIHLNRRNDPASAAACYERAIVLPAVPAYAERIYAGLLWREGRYERAVSALRAHLVNLQSGEQAATDPLLLAAVADRLRAWEEVMENANSKKVERDMRR
jgi:tetratricopeptide (TPR) repeat protein